MTGTVTFANGIETDNLNQTVTVNIFYSPACINAEAGRTVTINAAICSGIGSAMVDSSGFSSASCSFASGGCACSMVEHPATATAPQAYVVSGNTVTYPAGGGSPMDYCVSGTTLTTRETEAGVTFFTTLHKQ